MRGLEVADALARDGWSVGLVNARFAKPLDRDNRGTLWRVYLPPEAFGEPLGEDVLVGRATELRVVTAATATATPTATATATATSTSTEGATPTSTSTEGATDSEPPAAPQNGETGTTGQSVATP